MDNGLHWLGSIEILVLLKPQIHRGQRRKKSHYAYGLCFYAGLQITFICYLLKYVYLRQSFSKYGPGT